jgi:metallo-beta-lactamase family protein
VRTLDADPLYRAGLAHLAAPRRARGLLLLSSMPWLSFLGAIDTVTGSRYLVESAHRRVLIDCGLFQGPKKLRERNWREVPLFAGLDAVVLTHAHIDHSGYLPRLCKLGYEGPVYCTPGTKDLLELLLPDAGHLQEEEAAHANKFGYARHHPALPLYTREEAERCLEQLRPIAYDTQLEVAPGVTAAFSRAGHIVGSSSVRVAVEGVSIAFSGDVGRRADPIMRPPAPVANVDYLICESTYGDRRHQDHGIEEALERVIVQTLERRGVVVVPAFAVGRAQHLLYLLSKLRAANRIPACPIYLDSPLAIDATRRFAAHVDDHRLSPAECAAMAAVARYAQTPDDSKAIDRSSGPMIVVAASGMCTGGRVLHHLQRFLPDERSTILFVGFQASGTRGRSLLDGAKELKLLGGYVPVRAQIAHLDGLSAHADYAELLEWLRTSNISPKQVFVTHGEPAAADAMRRRLRETFNWNARVPEVAETVKLERV